MSGLFMFSILPYVAIASLLVGSIYRYRSHGYRVSSLSSQFLESNQLYFGNRPFHWGIVVLFFGHLIGFLIPRAVLAWNGTPLRLYILEITAFSFAIITITGLIILIVRRFKVTRLHVVTTRMDVFVYVILLVQIISGLWIAFFYRWGSSWFALVLTPYLRSIFTLNLETTAVMALPLMVKIHIIAAFVLIGMIPYTRFMHFLVYPLDYIWRANQVVIWNYRREQGL